jgi:glycosyltransferase involved in cell wall biosynthesis
VRTHLFFTGASPASLPNGVTASPWPASCAEAASATETLPADVDAVMFWSFDLGPAPFTQLSQFAHALEDAWVAPITPAPKDLLAYAEPVWIYRRPPRTDGPDAISWHLDPRAAIVRAAALRAVGGLDGTFDTIAGAVKELGLRFIRRGAICRRKRELVGQPLAPSPISRADEYRILRRTVSAKWAAYSLVRSVLDSPAAIVAELGAWRTTRQTTRAPAQRASLQRDVEAVSLPSQPTVTVVLPTYGRYRYVEEVLEDLRAQTTRPTQILIADGNPPDERDPAVYARFADLPIEVIWHPEPGICSGRNECLARATGDYVWFVDDDSRFDARNLEMHLRVLVAYNADVSVGPAYTKGRPELAPEQRDVKCAFMDCGTTLVRRELLVKTGGFDMQYNLYLRGEDNDLGIRFIREGGVMLNNPHAKRFHYLAPVGGSRTKGSPHIFKRWSLMPRPVQSVYYLARRHFEASAAWDAMVQGTISVGWRPPGAGRMPRAWKARTLAAELLAAPLTAVRFYRSYRIGARMYGDGPRIPSLGRADESRRNNAY